MITVEAEGLVVFACTSLSKDKMKMMAEIGSQEVKLSKLKSKLVFVHPLIAARIEKARVGK